MAPDRAEGGPRQGPPPKVSPPSSTGVSIADQADGRRRCTVEGCQRPHAARGLCRRHYRQVPYGRAALWEYRVTWTRKGWARDGKHGANRRVFDTLGAAQRFLGRLTGPDRPELAPFSMLQLERRPVGAWEPVDLDGEP